MTRKETRGSIVKFWLKKNNGKLSLSLLPVSEITIDVSAVSELTAL